MHIVVICNIDRTVLGEISKVRTRDTCDDCDMTDVCVVGNRQMPGFSVCNNEVYHVWMQISKVRNSYIHRAMVYNHLECVEIVVR